jgi:hypothetical protein
MQIELPSNSSLFEIVVDHHSFDSKIDIFNNLKLIKC